MSNSSRYTLHDISLDEDLDRQASGSTQDADSGEVDLSIDWEDSGSTGWNLDSGDLVGRSIAGLPPGPHLPHLGDFRLLRELGRGGMAVVYEAIQISLGRRVAVKVLLSPPGVDPRRLRRFQVEAQAAASLRHPHIVPVYATGSAGGIPYYAMQYIQGRDLARIIEDLKRGPSTLPAVNETGLAPPRRPIFDCGLSFDRDAARLAHQAALALTHAHAHEIVHRDIKPSNLLLDDNGNLWVTDFGLARIRGGLELTQTGEALGTPRYMSPEQVQAHRVPLDGRTDVYSLGATLYELLTLTAPFPGNDRIEILRKIVEAEPIAPRKLEPRIPADLETIVLKSMAKAPEERYATAAELAADLRRFLDDRPILARRPSLAHRSLKWACRHRRIVLTVALGLLFATVFLTAAMFQYTIWLRDHSAKLEAEVARADRNAQLANRHRREADRHLHAAQLRLASASIETGQFERAQDILQDQVAHPGEDDPRDFVWHVLWDRATGDVDRLHGHDRDVLVLAESPAGRLLASGDEQGEIRLWDQATGRQRAVLKAHTRPIRRLVFTQDGSLLASTAHGDGDTSVEIVLWETAGGGELARIPDLAARSTANPSFSSTEPALVIDAFVTEQRAGDRSLSQIREIRTYSLSYGPTRLELRSVEHPEGNFCVANGRVVHFRSIPQGDPDRWSLASESNSAVWSFDAARFGDQVVAATSPDGQAIAAVFGGRLVSCREVATGKELYRCISDGPVRAFALGPGARALAVASFTGSIELHSLGTGKRVTIAIGPTGRENPVLHLAFSPDGARLATSEWALPGGATPLTLWDVASGKPLCVYPGRRQGVSDLLFSSDGTSVLIAAGPTIARWFPNRAPRSIRLGSHDDEAWSVAFSAEGGFLATGSDDDDRESIRLWDPVTGARLRGWHAGIGTTAAIAVAPGGQILASAHLDDSGSIRIWEVGSGKLRRTLSGHTGKARALAFHPRGNLLATGGADRQIRIWDLSTGACVRILKGHRDTVQDLAFSTDGETLASASSDSTIGVWDVTAGRLKRALHGAEKFTAAAFSPDGRILASAGESGPIRLWDVLTAQELHSISEFSGHVHALEFAPDGSSLAFASHDGMVGLCRTDLSPGRNRPHARFSREPEPKRPGCRMPGPGERPHSGRSSQPPS